MSSWNYTITKGTITLENGEWKVIFSMGVPAERKDPSFQLVPPCIRTETETTWHPFTKGFKTKNMGEWQTTILRRTIEVIKCIKGSNASGVVEIPNWGLETKAEKALTNTSVAAMDEVDAMLADIKKM